MRPKRTRIQHFAQILNLPNGNTATQLFRSRQRARFAQTPNGRAGYPQQHQHHGEAYEGLVGKAVEVAQGIGKSGGRRIALAQRLHFVGRDNLQLLIHGWTPGMCYGQNTTCACPAESLYISFLRCWPTPRKAALMLAFHSIRCVPSCV